MKQGYSERPPREEYLITAAGRDFMPVLQAIGAWGRRHNGAGALTQAVDAETGTAVDPVVIDHVTGAPIGTRALRLVKPGTAGEQAATRREKDTAGR